MIGPLTFLFSLLPIFSFSGTSDFTAKGGYWSLARFRSLAGEKETTRAAPVDLDKLKVCRGCLDESPLSDRPSLGSSKGVMACLVG